MARENPLAVRLATAEQAVNRLGETYAASLAGRVAAISEPVAGLRQRDEVAGRARLHAIAFELKGEAGSFGFPGVSRAAASLCRLAERPGPLTPAIRAALQAHADGIAALAGAAVPAEDPTAAAVIEALEAITARLAPAP